jgi:hypothetical protein
MSKHTFGVKHVLSLDLSNCLRQLLCKGNVENVMCLVLKKICLTNFTENTLIYLKDAKTL